MEASALTNPGTAAGLRGPSPLLRLQSDERLIALTRRGQHAAFETLCSRYQARLLAFCRHMLGSREDAEDVLQEVFTAAFNAVLADERAINVRPWLYRIARNRSLNHLRRNSATGVDSMDVYLAEGGVSTGEKVLRRESFRELIGDVQHLPETQRSALLLREIDALSYEQIAQAMETTVPSVKSLLVRARISLAEAAEARKLSCDEVRLELGEVAEGLVKLSVPARRHTRTCEHCAGFKKQLKANNHALAAVLPVGPLLVFKKLLLAKLGFGSAHVAGGAGATMGAGATATAAATGGTSVAGGLVTAGAGALATKAVAGLAAAAIVTAGAVAADNTSHHHHHAGAGLSAASVHSGHYAEQPMVVHEQPQPISLGDSAAIHHRGALARRRAHLAKAVKPAVPVVVAPAVATPAVPLAATAPAPAAAKPAEPAPITEVTTETTELPSAATTGPTTTPVPSETATTPPAPPIVQPVTEATTPAAPVTQGAELGTPPTPDNGGTPPTPDSGGAPRTPGNGAGNGGTAAPANAAVATAAAVGVASVVKPDFVRAHRRSAKRIAELELSAN
jgi:RNA polymerase sigma factor (sigma-70 family)